MPHFTTEIVDINTLPADVAEQWNALYESVPDACFYHHPHWIRSISEHLSGEPLQLALIKLSGILSMVLPFHEPASGPRLQYPTHDHLSLNDPLINPALSDPELIAEAIDQALVAIKSRWWDWRIRHLPDSSGLGSLRQLEGQTDQHWRFVYARDSAWFKLLASDCPPHGKLRRNLRRLRKQMEAEGALRTECVHHIDELPTAFEHFLQTEASGWKGEGNSGTAIQGVPGLSEFYRSLLRSNSLQLQPMINLLWLDDRCAAAQFCLRTGDCLSILKIGFDESFAQYSPGSLLLEDVLKHARDDGVERLSLVTCPEWSIRWHPQIMPVWHVTRFNSCVGGHALRHLARIKLAAKPAVKSAVKDSTKAVIKAATKPASNPSTKTG